MPLSMFRFGFMAPGELEGLLTHGWDGGSSHALIIVATSPEEAEAWGCDVAEWFVKELFEREAWKGEMPSWKVDAYPYWLEEDIGELKAIIASGHTPVIEAGRYPAWSEIWVW